VVDGALVVLELERVGRPVRVQRPVALLLPPAGPLVAVAVSEGQRRMCCGKMECLNAGEIA